MALTKVLTPFRILIAVTCMALSLEIVCYHTLLTRESSLTSADAVVVFHGAKERVEEGYRLVNGGDAPLLVVSPATDKTRERYDAVYGHTGRWEHLVEARATTTFQNALLTARLVREHGLKKILLVTDGCHMPRSYLLLRMMLMDYKVEILPVRTPGTAYAGFPFEWTSRQWKKIYNESVEFWGSLTEMVMYKVRGDLPEKGLKDRGWVQFLRGVLLVEVD